MSLVMAALSPHPPIVVPEVGRGSLAQVSATVESLRSMGEMVRQENPETLIVMSPHSPSVGDAFLVRAAGSFAGSLGMFGAPELRYEMEGDSPLAAEIARTSGARGLPTIGPEEDTAGRVAGGSVLDHGMLVPMYFISPPEEWRLVSLGISYLELAEHYEFGKAIREATEGLGRRAVFIASGDLSHRLTPDAPAGYSPRGREFDQQMRGRLEQGELAGMVEWDSGLVQAAGECGLRSIVTMAGMFDGRSPDCSVLSYEGPFGVGYLVAIVREGG